LKRLFLISICFCLFLFTHCLAQDNSAIPGHEHNQSDSTNKKRVVLVTAANGAFYTGSLIILNAAWYKGFQKSSFHVFDDSKEWLQVDKVGHSWTAYNMARGSFGMWKWTGLPQDKAAIISGINGMTYLTVIEFLDAHSAEWGWSWSDFTANVLGSGMFTAQELLWKEQRIQFKFSFHGVDYKNSQLNTRADDLYGKSWQERMLKDYNGQTYWLSANIHSFFPETKLPKWLNIAAGYGADGMFGGFENIAKDANGNFTFNRSDIPRLRQFYISPDIDLTRIKTNKKWLKSAFNMLSLFKIPAPALMIDSKGKMKLNGLYF
jgi:hypothetical protein